jgi:hypothetical protein
VQPSPPWPPQHEQAAERDECDEAEMQQEDKIGEGTVDHSLGNLESVRLTLGDMAMFPYNLPDTHVIAVHITSHRGD